MDGMDCNGYMQGFDNFRIEVMHQLRHIGPEMQEGSCARGSTGVCLLSNRLMVFC